MRQRCWIDILKEYDCKIIYHSDRGNVVTDALSRKEFAVLAQTIASSWKLVDAIQSLHLSYYGNGTYLAHFQALLDLFIKIWEA